MMPKLLKILRKTTSIYTNVSSVKIYEEMEQVVEEFVEPIQNYYTEDVEDNFMFLDVHTEYKNFDNLDTRKRQNIMFLCPDLTDRARCKHIVDAALALKACGHKVTIVTCAYLENCYNQDLSQIKLILVGQWIPRDIFGLFQSTFYLIRSVYSAIWTSYTFRNVKRTPSVLFLETNYMALPILKTLTNFKVIYFQYKFEMALQHRPISDIQVEHTWFLKSSLQNADEILVPNGIFCAIYQRFCLPDKPRLQVCQPYIDVRQLKIEKMVSIQEILENLREASYIYLVLGEYHKNSNFELIIEAFHMLLLNVRHEVHDKLHLVFSGYCSRNNRHHARYYRYLQKKVHDHRLVDRISFVRRLDKCHKKSLMMNAIAILDPAVDVLFNRYLLEAMALRRPIIATDTGFAQEVLQHGVSGYLVPPTAEHFSKAMADILLNKRNGEYIATLAYREFQKTYSFEAYGKRLNELVYKYCDKRKNVKILSRTST